MFKVLKLFVFVVALAVLAGCGVRYAPRVPGFCPGYADKQLGESTYQIVIGEAWPKDWPDLEKFAVYRAAELTKEAGKNYYVILNASSMTSNYAITSPTTATTTGSAYRVGNTVYGQATTTYRGGQTTNIQGGWYYLDFKIISDDELKNYPQVVKADTVMSDLKYFIDSRR